MKNKTKKQPNYFSSFVCGAEGVWFRFKQNSLTPSCKDTEMKPNIKISLSQTIKYNSLQHSYPQIK